MSFNRNRWKIRSGGRRGRLQRAGQREGDLRAGSQQVAEGAKGLEISAKDIDVVILTHLHFDHSGGCTKLDRTGTLVPTFPKAQYIVQRECWEEASSPNERCQDIHRWEDYNPIEERGQLELIDGDQEIFPGLWVKVTNGHSRGHQIVQLHHGGERIAFLGDLVPTAHHLDLGAISAYDQFPEDTLERKRELLGQAEKDGWLIIFSPRPRP